MSGAKSQRERAAAHQMAAGVATMPNFSSAVSAQRFEPLDSLDDYPTPPWGARAWVEHVVGPEAVSGLTCWEPAANRGYLVRPLAEYFARVAGSDIADYGHGFPLFDFIGPRDGLFGAKPPIDFIPDFVVTNPPFNRLLDFALRGLEVARVGVAILCRLQCLEGIERHSRLFSQYGDRYVFSAFVERISFIRGKIDPKAARPSAFGWLTIWKEPQDPAFLLARRHIPPCRKRLERDTDYPA